MSHPCRGGHLLALQVMATAVLLAACTPTGPDTGPETGPAAERPAAPAAEAGLTVVSPDTVLPEITALSEVTALPESTAPASIEPPARGGSPLDCAEPVDGTMDWVACNTIAGIRSRNTSALLSFMVDPFAIGDWRSEWRAESPAAVVAELDTRLPLDRATPPTFSANRSTFPALDGLHPEDMLGPDANVTLVVLGEGWGLDGGGEALLLFTTDSGGRHRWSGLLYAPEGFE